MSGQQGIIKQKVITDGDLDNRTIRINPVTHKLEATGGGASGSLGEWVNVPAKYLPKKMAECVSLMVRFTQGLYEVRATVNKDTGLVSLEDNTTNGKQRLPYAWTPEFPVTVILLKDSYSAGRVVIEDGGRILFTGYSLTAASVVTNYQAIRHSKAPPTTPLT